MKKTTILFFTIVTLLASVSFSQNEITTANVTFQIRNLGFNVDGKFSKSHIVTDFSSDAYSEWTLQGHAEIASIDTDNDSRDEHLMEEDYFDKKNHPRIILEAKTFTKTGDHSYNVEVDLTIKGTTKRLTIPMQITKTDTKEELSCAFEINRRDFDVGGGSFVLSKTVKVRVAYNL